MKTILQNSRARNHVKAGVRVVLVGSVAAVLLLSCATVPSPLRQGTVRAITEAVNAGSVDRLIKMSATSFAFDGEVYDRAEDISALWKGLISDGLKLQAPTADQPVTAESYRQFSNGTMTRWFFSRYVPKRARIITVPSNFGVFLLVAGDSGTPEPVIYGLSGPTGQGG